MVGRDGERGIGYRVSGSGCRGSGSGGREGARSGGDSGRACFAAGVDGRYTRRKRHSCLGGVKNRNWTHPLSFVRTSSNVRLLWANLMNTAVPYPLDDAILERFTGQRAIRNTAETERRIEQATTERKCTESENRRARRFERRCRAKLNAAHSHLACCRLSLAVRRRGWSPGLAALVASGILAVPLAVIVGIAAPHSLWVLIAFALAVIVAGITFLTMLSDIDVQAAAARLETALQNALCARKAHDRTEVALQGRIAVERAARKLHAGLLRAINSELNELINTEVDNMAGLDFERHLERVFNALGYQVKHTGQSGD